MVNRLTGTEWNKNAQTSGSWLRASTSLPESASMPQLHLLPPLPYDYAALEPVIEGLGALKEPCSVEVWSDSRYVIDGMKSWLANWKQAQLKRGIGPVVDRNEAFLDVHGVSRVRACR